MADTGTPAFLFLLPLALQLVLRSTAKNGQKSMAGLAMLLPVGLMATIWTLVFFIW